MGVPGLVYFCVPAPDAPQVSEERAVSSPPSSPVTPSPRSSLCRVLGTQVPFPTLGCSLQREPEYSSLRLVAVKQLLLLNFHAAPVGVFSRGTTRISGSLSCPGKNTGVGCHFLLQGIFLTQRSNQSLLHCRQNLYHLSYDQIRSDQISRSVVSDSLRPHASQHARPPCPSPTPGVHSDSRPSSR